jgi:hypothetical protein
MELVIQPEPGDVAGLAKIVESNVCAGPVQPLMTVLQAAP